MKAIALYGPRKIKIVEIEKPEVGPNDVLLSTKAAGICGTDLHSYVGEWKPFERFIYDVVTIFFPWKAILGHEFSGLVADRGENITNFKLGEKVTAWPIMPCHKCEACRSGFENQCKNEQRWPGAFAEFVRVPVDNIVKVPAQLSLEEAAMIEPLAVVLHAAKLAKIKKYQKTAIIGAGTIGLLLLQVIRSLGVENVVITDVLDFPLEIALKLGAESTLNTAGIKGQSIVKTVGFVDVVFECVGGDAPTVHQALNMVKDHGKIVVLGGFSEQQIDMLKFRLKETAIIGSQGSLKREFEEAIDLVIHRKVQIKPLITHIFPFSKAKDAFETALRKEQTKSIKVLIKLD